jgi:hypothetical protein
MPRKQTLNPSPKDKRLGVIMSEEMWKELRRISYETNLSMNELSREGINYIIRKYSNSKK